MDQIATRTQIVLAEGVTSKPSNFLLQKLERLTVEPGSLTTGPESAKAKYTEMLDLINEGIEERETVLNNPGVHTKSIVSKAAASRESLVNLRNEYMKVLEGFDGQEPEVQSFTNVETGQTYQLAPDEDVAENPETGEVMIYRDGAWVLVK